jgi:hypothetical protein
MTTPAMSTAVVMMPTATTGAVRLAVRLFPNDPVEHCGTGQLSRLSSVTTPVTPQTTITARTLSTNSPTIFARNVLEALPAIAT